MTQLAPWATRIRQNVQQVIVGHDKTLEYMLVALLSEGHVLLEDVPGVGKTTMIRALALSLDCSFQRIQSTPDLLPSDISGLTFFNPAQSSFEFRAGPIFANLVLADEINRATPRTQSALLEAMQERTVTIDGTTHQLPRPFLVFATQNPIELEGTYPLPEAQLDRFLLRLKLGYPSATEEVAIVERFEAADPLTNLQAVASAAELQQLRPLVQATLLDPVVRDYAIELIRATRHHSDIELGCSPRGSLALIRAARTLAALRGHEYVLPDHIQELAPAVMEHRLILAPEARMRGRTPASVIQDVVQHVSVPVESA